MEKKWIVSTSEFAKLIEKSDRWVRDLAKLSGFERQGKISTGKWDLSICMPILYNYLLQKQEGQETEKQDLDLRYEQARLSAIKADRETLQFRVEQNKHIHIDDVMQYALGRDVAIAEQIDAIPSRYTPAFIQALTKNNIEIEPAVIYEILEHIKNEVRQDVTNGLAALIPVESRDTDSKTST